MHWEMVSRYSWFVSLHASRSGGAGRRCSRASKPDVGARYAGLSSPSSFATCWCGFSTTAATGCVHAYSIGKRTVYGEQLGACGRRGSCRRALDGGSAVSARRVLLVEGRSRVWQPHRERGERRGGGVEAGHAPSRWRRPPRPRRGRRRRRPPARTRRAGGASCEWTSPAPPAPPAPPAHLPPPQPRPWPWWQRRPWPGRPRPWPAQPRPGPGPPRPAASPPRTTPPRHASPAP